MIRDYDVIVIGGSYAGLSAAMALGRSLRKTLVIDSGRPCNRQTPHSHNFLTNDGSTPADISSRAKKQVQAYPSVSFVDSLAVSAKRTGGAFEVMLDNGERFNGKRILFATGVKDILPEIPGFAESWGISVLHCPYCHGYEVRGEATGIFANGEMGYEFARLINHWTKDLSVFTNGPSQFTSEQHEKIVSKGITVIETPVDFIDHIDGYVKAVHLRDGKSISLKAIYARPALVQHCAIPLELGCEVTEHGLLKVDMLQRATVPGIYAAGDNTTMMRSVSLAVAAGGMAGAAMNKELIESEF